MDNQQLFEVLGQLLSQLLSPDANIRKQSEEQLEKHWLANQPGPFLAGLSNFIVHHSDAYVRLLLMKSSEVFALSCCEAAGEDVLKYVQTNLLQSLASEQDVSVRNKVADTISQIALFLVNNKELFQACAEYISSPNPLFRKSAFMIFSGCPKVLIKQDQNSVKSIFMAGVQDSDLDVRLAALKATVNYICVSKQAVRNAMADLLPHLLNVIPGVMAHGGKEDEAVEGLTDIIELAQLFPKMFKPVLEHTVTYMVSQMKNTDLENGTRQTCLELLLTLCEGAPAQMRKYEPFAHSLIPVILEWMSELEDEPEWYAVETIEDDDDSSNETAGEQAMDRLAMNLKGNIVLPIAFQLIPTLLSSPEWQKRHAALRCISAIGEGCYDIMKKELEKVIGLILPHLKDPHPRVRHAACNAIGQMCTDFAPTIQEQFHQPILTHLIPIMDDLAHIRVANYGAAALVNFSENASKECIAPYIEPIISKLLVLMNTGKIFAQEQAITTLATVADSASLEFTKYYSNIMQVLLQILRFPDQKELRSLKGKTLECSSLIILAVGKEVFAPDFVPFVEVLKNIQSTISDPDDPQNSYLLSAWARLCKVMGTDFAPYLEIVLPPLLKSVEIKPKMVAFDADEAGDEYNEEDGWEVMAVGDKNLAIKTSLLEDKCTAVEMLLCYAEELGAIFHPYVEGIMKMIVPLLKFYLNDGVRYASASLIPVLLNCWIKADYQLRDAPDYDPEDEEALKDEEYTDEQFLADAAVTVSSLFKTFGTAFLPFFDQMISKLSEFLENKDAPSRQWALCVFCDLIEFTGPASVQYQPFFLAKMAASLGDASPDVRQAAAYGVGVSAKFGGPNYAQFCVESLPHLFNIINAPNSRSEENTMATENAISAVGKLLEVYRSTGAFSANDVILHWFNSLPIVEDAEEAPETYSLLLELIEGQNEVIVNVNQIPKLVSILSEALSLKDLLVKDPALKEKMVNCLKSVIAAADANTKQILWQGLKDGQKKYLSSLGLV
ncbi:Importin-5 [Boothiomyces macroporosus]|uniref:Importin-5 n=1 Tax=Boothiomyces macroporosus TaxID=261099 RepID=A0AAD5UAQ4_9FUNG|nr:Importin-5 [Boothiomyces macroporosus]